MSPAAFQQTSKIPPGPLYVLISEPSYTAPIALKTAAELLEIANSNDISLTEGLSEELNYLEEIFSTKDALEGLSSLIEGRRPNYTDC